MQPLPLRTRRLYLLGLILVFVVVFPVIILYATGYHLTRDFALVETGGVFVTLEMPGAIISVNNDISGRSTLLDRNFLEQNLKPGLYSLKVERDGYYPWVKVVTVEPSYVTDARAIFIPTAIDKVELLPLSQKPKGATSTPGMSYLSVAALGSATSSFKTLRGTTTMMTASSTVPVARSGNTDLYIQNGNLIARYDGATSTAPSNFCLTPTMCVSDITIEKATEEVTNADFLFGDAGAVIYTTERGVYVTEVDVRSPQLLVPIYQVRGADFRFVDDALIIKDGKRFYRLEGF